MNTFGFIQATISSNQKDPHPKALEHDYLFPRIAIMAQLLKGRSRRRRPVCPGGRLASCDLNVKAGGGKGKEWVDFFANFL
jgi:hypothetical protein